MVEIKGIIGERPEEADMSYQYTSFLDVVVQVKKEESETIHVLIDSIGGDLEQGFQIYEHLRSLGKTIKTECVNNCASAASIIFLSGDTRIAGCPIMIHNPWVEGVSGDSKGLRQTAEWIEEYEKRSKDIYSKRTGIDKQALSSLMDNETYISPEKAVTLGFATEGKRIALAQLNNLNEKNGKKMSTEKKGFKQLIFSAFGMNPEKESEKEMNVYSMQLSTTNGDTITVDREEGFPQVGDSASPDGSHIMPDGTIIVIENGLIVSIDQVEDKEEVLNQLADGVEEAVSELQNEIKSVKAENENVKAENENLKSALALAKSKEKTVDELSVLNAVKMAGGINKVFSGISSQYKPESRISKDPKLEVNNPMRERINQIKSEKKGGK